MNLVTYLGSSVITKGIYWILLYILGHLLSLFFYTFQKYFFLKLDQGQKHNIFDVFHSYHLLTPTNLPRVFTRTGSFCWSKVRVCYVLNIIWSDNSDIIHELIMAKIVNKLYLQGHDNRGTLWVWREILKSSPPLKDCHVCYSEEQNNDEAFRRKTTVNSVFYLCFVMWRSKLISIFSDFSL